MFYRLVCCLVPVMWLISALDESCLELPPVNNSIFIVKEVEGQMLGTYVCIKGYHLVGKKTFLCNASEGWNDFTTECRLGHCPDPVLVNGEIQFFRPVNISDKITFKCNDHYVLQGSSWSQCLENHTWSPPFPICKSRDSGPHGDTPHRYCEGGNSDSGSTSSSCGERNHPEGPQKQVVIEGDLESVLTHERIHKPCLQTGFEKALVSGGRCLSYSQLCLWGLAIVSGSCSVNIFSIWYNVFEWVGLGLTIEGAS
uniref:C4b-binding protein beta chain isoform X1 n=1 Tax=Ictidomys tridecemlineatus TaxID=43179 RepID=UPI001A9DF6F5|nr:C4b-binding protein beta chain isoform X1 [Ictidomys tridecemlineatus]XP_040133871.1 C4b-binding protein beta chain isoform X1 [Ictidomys tridecemlineatus]